MRAADDTAAGGVDHGQAKAQPAAPAGASATTTGQETDAAASSSDVPAAEPVATSAPAPASRAGAGADGATADGGAPGNSGAAPGHSDPAPGNGDPAPGNGDSAPGKRDAAPGHDADPGASVVQHADSSANAEQHGVGNAKVDVRVDKPGNGPQVSQENRAEGNADATTAAETSGPATSDQTAAAAAEASQSDVGNTAVTVRVGSSGDDAGMAQANVAVATASTTVVPPEEGQGAVDETASAAATQEGVANTSVSIRVFSPGADGPVTQSNEAVAAADSSGSDGAAAAATQDGVQNTRVSVRVQSPGASGAVDQQSVASATVEPGGTATTGGGIAVATTKNGLDTDLAVVVDGDALARPGANGLQVWVWTWNWGRDESDGIGASVDPQPSSWNWAWSTAGQTVAQPGQVTRIPAEGPATPGSWTWNWNWTRDGAPDWIWQWDWQAAAPCASCVWIWNWTWNWTGQPVPTGSSQSPPETTVGGGTSPDQSNVAVANADATVTADVTQTIARAGDGGQFAGQLVSVAQSADATASAMQSDVEAVATANGLLPQANRVTGEASVTVAADVAQRSEQTTVAGGEGAAAQWSGQEIDLVQQARADVRAEQHGLSPRRAGTHAASALASAEAVAGVDQGVVQDALVSGGASDQWAGQLTVVEQGATAASLVEQTGAGVPPAADAAARAGSSSGAVARVGQGLAQSAARAGGLGSQTAMQIAYVGQTGAATATTTQRAGGAAIPVASSSATAVNRALVIQDGVQESTGVLALDVQDLTQQAIVVQDAVAVSTSAGGIAGSAVVVNCAVVEQTAAQSLGGAPAAASAADLSAFCAPPSVPAAGGQVDDATAPAAAASAAAPGGTTASSAGLPADLEVDVDVTVFHGRPSAALHRQRSRTTSPRVALVRSAPGVGRPRTGAPSITQISVPPPTQARLDTRPGDHAGAGDAGREPPLPPAGGPPLRVSALAAAVASGAGPSGIAAILLAFALVPPLLVRAREGSVVRRPVGAFSRVDVPV